MHPIVKLLFKIQHFTSYWTNLHPLDKLLYGECNLLITKALTLRLGHVAPQTAFMKGRNGARVCRKGPYPRVAPLLSRETRAEPHPPLQPPSLNPLPPCHRRSMGLEAQASARTAAAGAFSSLSYPLVSFLISSDLLSSVVATSSPELHHAPDPASHRLDPEVP